MFYAGLSGRNLPVRPHLTKDKAFWFSTYSSCLSKFNTTRSGNCMYMTGEEQSLRCFRRSGTAILGNLLAAFPK